MESLPEPEPALMPEEPGVEAAAEKPKSWKWPFKKSGTADRASRSQAPAAVVKFRDVKRS